MLLYSTVFVLTILSLSTLASSRRTTIETIVETVTRRVVHYQVRQCTCEETEGCESDAKNRISQCFDQCQDHLEAFRNQTKENLSECFNKNSKAAIEADECFFDEMPDFCRKDNQRRFINPSNLADHTGFELKMEVPYDNIEEIPLFQRALGQFMILNRFFQCTKRCMHTSLATCYKRKRCAILLPSKDVLHNIFNKCNKHNPEISQSLFATCQCLAYKKRVPSLFGLCPIISNPLFIEN